MADVDEEEEELEDPADKDSLTRRRIYLQRLVGDDIHVSKKVTVRHGSWRGVVRFLFYAIVATVVIMNRSHVAQLGTINRGLLGSLKNRWFRHAPERKYFDDITTVGDVKDWVLKVLLNNTMSNEGADPTYVLNFNRVTPLKGVCLNHSAIMMTMRRIDVTADYRDTTTSRFHKLVPNVTSVNTLQAGSSTQPGKEVKKRHFNWYYTKAASSFLEFGSGGSEESRFLGYNRAGGYVAVITLGPGASDDVYVHMMGGDYYGFRRPDYRWGTCDGGLRENVAFWLPQFPWDEYLDRQLGSLAFDYVVYNANLQSMSVISIAFNTNMAGLVYQKEIKVKTLMLNTYHGWMRYFEVMYLVFTLCYFLELCYRSWKKYPNNFKEIWFYINFVSIVSSLTSLIVWHVYEPYLTVFRNQDRGFESEAELVQAFEYFQWYMWASAVAVLTIYLRILQFLSNTRVRVMLLWRTLSTGMGNIIIYGLYISAVIWGFVAFANTHFSSFSPAFVTWGDSFLSCFEMFFGKVGAMDTIQDSDSMLKKPFYMLYMICFYFISVQMFNAIINFSYNHVSEEMEPQFERERNENKRQDMQNRVLSRKSTLMKIKERLMSWTNRPKQDESKDVAKDVAGSDKAKGPNSAPNLDNLDAAVKEKVDAYLTKDQNIKRSDSFMSGMMFFFFAIVYIAFLYVNLRIEQNYAVRRAVETAVYDTVVEWDTPDKGQADYIFWDDIVSLGLARHWIVNALPEAMFNSTSQATNELAAAQGIREDLVCIRNWNCLVWGRESANGMPKIVRMTQRRMLVQANDGRLKDDDPPEFWYTGGRADDGTSIVSHLSPWRRGEFDIDPFSSPDTAYENTTASGLTFDSLGCEVLAPGAGGFRSYGGIVCTFDMDFESFQQEVAALDDHDFFNSETGSIVIEFVLYNANQDMLTYVVLSFVVGASGEVTKGMEVISMKLFNVGFFHDNIVDIFLRVLPGILYLILVFCFIVMLWNEFKREQQRKSFNEHTSTMASAYEFFIKDTFNLLDCLSIIISLLSAGLFIAWVVREGQMKSKVVAGREGAYSEFLSYCSDLGFSAVLYNRLSSINVLMIFVRPLKFVRENARIARLNQTLYEAGTDIYWFVIMLFITIFGFVMFTYVSFGPFLKECDTVSRTFRYSFNYMLGNFDFDPLFVADPYMAWCLLPYLVLFYCVFSNIFFAIIDRFFVNAEPPPFQWKRKLKPIFQRICRCIEWDEDYVMEADPNAEKKQGPPSRRNRAQEAQKKLQEIRSNSANGVSSTVSGKKSKLLSDVCEVDERMSDVLHWSREEARKLVEEFIQLIDRKGTVKNDEEFIRREVMQNTIKDRLTEVKKEMEDAKRHMQYATKVHEQMATRDQETLAKYVLLLERKIKTKMVEQHTLKTEVQHLKAEDKKMRFNKDEPDDQGDMQTAGDLALEFPGDNASSASGSRSSHGSDAEQDVDDLGAIEDQFAGNAQHASNEPGGQGDPDAPAGMHSARSKRKLAEAIKQFGEDEDVG